MSYTTYPSDMTLPQQPYKPQSGVWIAYASDSNGIGRLVAFDQEIDALRCAVNESGLKVTFLSYGVDLIDHLAGQDKKVTS